MFYIVYLKIYEYKYSQTLCHFFIVYVLENERTDSS